MIHNGHVDSVEVTVRLGRLFGGLWAYKPFTLRHGNESLPCITGADGSLKLRLIQSPGTWSVEADHRLLGTFTAEPTDFTVVYNF